MVRAVPGNTIRGFDSARDILAITVNRWPHGYAYQYNSLWDPFWIDGGPLPCVAARRPFGHREPVEYDHIWGYPARYAREKSGRVFGLTAGRILAADEAVTDFGSRRLRNTEQALPFCRPLADPVAPRVSRARHFFFQKGEELPILSFLGGETSARHRVGVGAILLACEPSA